MSSTALLLLATGRDRPGIVDRLSRLVYEAGCNLEDSRMALLGGEFALIVLVTAVEVDLRRFEQALPELARELDLTIQVKPTQARRQESSGAVLYRLRAVALDHPGIVHKLTRVLSRHRANVVRLDTSLSYAPVSGSPMFSMEVDAEIPQDVSLARLRDELTTAAATENIDLELRPVP